MSHLFHKEILGKDKTSALLRALDMEQYAGFKHACASSFPVQTGAARTAMAASFHLARNHQIILTNI